MLSRLFALGLTSTAAVAVNVTIYQPNVTIAPRPLPPPGPSSHGEDIIRQFMQTSRTTHFRLVDRIPFEGDCFEPEGLIRVGEDRFFVSAGEYIEATVPYNKNRGKDGTDRTAGAGFGPRLSSTDEYRPNSTARLVRMDPVTLEPEPLLRIADHQGAAVHDLSTGIVLTLNWGGRTASLWDMARKAYPPPGFTSPLATVPNPSF
ncbi:hypothetical protein F5Y18DRAFT_436012 [Xylariaceae sp. FL1019]|nr:hypothetical protein F5Y18DRAFT_436012 [Xylariaceae sp. FL1019]